MPDFKIYIPEAKVAVLYQYKEQFGKDGSGMIMTFMENALNEPGKEKIASIDTVFDSYFGDIENENSFLYLFETRESAHDALKNRSNALYQKYPDIYLDVIAQFKEKFPKFANIKGT